MTVYCESCDLTQDGIIVDGGALACMECGKILANDYFVEEVTFTKGPNGQSKIQGALMQSFGDKSDSIERSLKKGEDRINVLMYKLKIGDTNFADPVELDAKMYYKAAFLRDFTKGRKVDHVAAACLYVACRAHSKPYLLIDFSNELAVSVYVIGAIFLLLFRVLGLANNQFFQKLVDPSLFLHRFTGGLVNMLDDQNAVSKYDVHNINETALKIITSMKRDWMQTGRKPSGLCGAAIYIAALANGIRFSKSDVMKVVHVCEATLTKRLIEFENTESGGLTIDEFEKKIEDFNEKKLVEAVSRSDNAELFCKLKHKDQKVEVHALGLCKECYDEFVELSGGISDGADPPSFQRTENEETVEKSAEPKFNYDTLGNYKELEDLANDSSEGLSDIDDTEFDCYVNTAEEKALREEIFDKMYKEYLEDKEIRDAARAAEMSNEQRAAQRLARKQKRKQKLLDYENESPPRTALDATIRLLNKKGIGKKFNEDVLKQILDEEGEELPSKKIRICNDEGVGEMAEGVYARLEQENAQENECYEPQANFDDNDQYHDSYSYPNYGGDDNGDY